MNLFETGELQLKVRIHVREQNSSIQDTLHEFQQTSNKTRVKQLIKIKLISCRSEIIKMFQ